MRRIVAVLALALCCATAALLHGCATPAAVTIPPPAAPSGVAGNFGFPLGFSPSKMDLTADPRQDFRRYAGGRWLDAATIPSDSLEISGYLVMAKAVEAQLKEILQDAAKGGPAPKGSPAQTVGDLYASGMDVERLRALGVRPLAPEFERIARADTPAARGELVARLQLVTGEPVLFATIVGPHPQDRARNTIYVGDADLPLGLDNYLKPEMQKIRDGYLVKIADSLVIAGWTPETARTAAQWVLAIETRMAKKKLTPLELRDPARRFVTKPYAELRQLFTQIDLDATFRAMGLPPGGEVITVEIDALRERNAILAELPAEQTRTYLQWELIRRMAKYLTPALDASTAAFNMVVYGKDVTPPRTRSCPACG